VALLEQETHAVFGSDGTGTPTVGAAFPVRGVLHEHASRAKHVAELLDEHGYPVDNPLLELRRSEGYSKVQWPIGSDGVYGTLTLASPAESYTVVWVLETATLLFLGLGN